MRSYARQVFRPDTPPRRLLALGLLLAACSAPTHELGPPVVRATAAGAGNSIEVSIAGRAVVLDVWSNRGTGSATVELVGGAAPTALELRLHLRALEELRITAGEDATVVSLDSSAGHTVSQRRIGPDGAEQPLDPASPGWLPLQIVAAQPDQPFPLRDGHIALVLPPALITAGAGAFSIQWVDFFRS